MGSSAQVIGFRYMLGVEAAGCLGPVDAFVQLDIGNRIAWKGNVTASTLLDVDQPWLFGGDTKEGGVSGIIEVRMGEVTQQPSGYMTSVIGTAIPANRGIFSLVFRGRNAAEIIARGLNISETTMFGRAPAQYVGRGGFYWSAFNPYIKPIAPTVTCILAGWGIPVWYAAKAKIVQSIDYSAPPVGSQTYTTSLRTAEGAGTTQLFYDVTNTDITLDFVGYALINAEWFKVLSVDTVHFIMNVLPAQFGTTAASHISGSTIFLYAVDLRPIVAMNAAHMLYRLIFDPKIGLGKPTSLANDAVWSATADTLFAEGFGLCMLWSQQATLEDFALEILKHIDGVLDLNLSTGLYELRLIRNDYDPATLPVFDQTNILSMDNFSRPGWGETTNEVVVQFTNQATGGANTVPVHDLASIFIQKQVVSITQTYAGIQDPQLAVRVGQRDLQALSTPLAAFTIKTNRVGWPTKKGDAVKVTWPANELNQTICRVLDVDTGTLEDGTITLTLVEDVFALPSVSQTSQRPQQPLWQDPAGAPASVSTRRVLEIPYQVLQSRIDTAALTGNESYPLVLAQRPAPQNSQFRTNQSDTTSFTVYEQLTSSAYNATVALSSACAWNDTTLQYNTPIGDAPDLYAGGLALLDDEWIGITSVDTVAGTMVVVRGVLDSIPVSHSLSAIVWLFSNGSFFNGFLGTGASLAKGTQEYYRVTGRSVSGETSITSAASIAHLHGATWNNPYPPSNVKIDGAYYPASVRGDFTISWGGRNRLQQTVGLIGWTDSSIAPEAGVTYTLQVYDATTNALIQQFTGIPCAAGGGAFQFQADAGAATSYRIVLFATRGNLQSQSFTATATIFGYGLDYDNKYGGAALGVVLPRASSPLPPGSVTPVPVPYWMNGAWYSRYQGPNLIIGPETVKSTDGALWVGDGPQTTVAMPGGNTAAVPETRIVFGNGVFAMTNATSVYWYRRNGSAWVSVDTGSFPSFAVGGNVNSITFDGSQFIMCKSDGKDLYTSPDAVVWTHVGVNSAANGLGASGGFTTKVVKVGSSYIAGRTASAGAGFAYTLATSTDLQTWTFTTVDPSFINVTFATYWNGFYYYLVGGLLWRSADLLAWTQLTLPFTLPPGFFGALSATVASLMLYGADTSPANDFCAVTTNGTTWTKTSLAFSGTLYGEKADSMSTDSPPNLFISVLPFTEYGGKLLKVNDHADAGPTLAWPPTGTFSKYFDAATATTGNFFAPGYKDGGLTTTAAPSTLTSLRNIRTGKHYVELTIVSITVVPGNPSMTVLLKDNAGSINSSALYGRSDIDFAPSVGDVLGYTLDMVVGSAQIFVNGVLYRTISGINTSSPIVFSASVNGTAHMNVGQEAFLFPQGGFTAWQD